MGQRPELVGGDPGLIKLVKGCNDVVESTMYPPGPRKLFPGGSRNGLAARRRHGGGVDGGRGVERDGRRAGLLLKQRSACTKRGEVQIIAEIGINHNGDMDLCKLIMASKVAGAQYAKIQKRNPDVCVPEAQKSKMRDTPWGRDVHRVQVPARVQRGADQGARRLRQQHRDHLLRKRGTRTRPTSWPSTPRSPRSSALINDLELCAYARDKFDELIVSTGMSTEAQVDACVTRATRTW